MKRKIIAIFACILVAGTAGVSAATTPSVANTVSTSAYAAANKNTNSTCTSNVAAANKALPAAAQKNCTLAAAAANCSNSSNTAANAVSKANTQNLAASQNASKCPVNVQNCANGNCLSNASNCANGVCSNGTCLTYLLNGNTNCLKNVLNCTNGTCISNILNCQNGNYTTANTCPNSSAKSAKPAGSSAPATPSTSSKPSTSTASTKPSTPSSAPSTTSQSNSSYASFQNQVIQLVNEQRAANGLKPLTANAQLANTATLKSEDMAKLNYFDHNSPTYGSPFDMMKKYGISYRTAGENIAMGQTTPAQVMQGWMNSPGHRANILNSSFTQIGVGIAKNAQGQLIWTQQFIG